MDSRRKSFKPYGQADPPERRPILSDQDRPDSHPHEISLKIYNDDSTPPQTDNHTQNPRSSSSSKTDNLTLNPHSSTDNHSQNSSERDYYSQNALKSAAPSGKPSHHSHDASSAPIGSDPPTELINKFTLQTQKAGVKMSPVLDLSNAASSSDSCPSDDNDDHKEKDDVIRFQRSSNLLIKTNSRLLDPYPPRQPSPDRKPGRPPRSGQFRSGPVRSGQFRSGPVRSSPVRSGAIKPGQEDEDDEDPFMDSEIPDEMKHEESWIITVLEWTGLIVIIAGLICTLVFRFLREYKLWSLSLWKWVVMVLVLICGRLFSSGFVKLAVVLIERNFLLKKKVLYFVYGVRSAVQYCLWLGLVLITWKALFDEKTSRDRVLIYVGKVLFCLLVATVLRLVKILLVKVLASSYHVSTYFDRIREAVYNHYIIETLSGPPIYEMVQTMAEVQRLQNAGAHVPIDLQSKILPNIPNQNIPNLPNQNTPNQNGPNNLPSQNTPNNRSSQNIGASGALNGGIDFDKLHKLTQKNVSAWSMKRLIKIIRHRSLVTLDERIWGEGQGSDDSERQIHSEKEAKIAARNIFINVAKPGAKHILLEDIERFMKEEDAMKAIHLIAGSKEVKRINRKVLKNWVVNAYKERRHLALTLNDTKTAVDQLHTMANVIVGIIVFVLWLLILGIATTQFFALLSTQLLLMVFVFGNTLKTVFESIVFLFVMHPFDVGDRCEVDNIQFVVEEMNIMTTIFLRYDNLKVTYPNTVLATKSISNFYRSPDMGDSIDFAVHVATPPDKIALMKDRIVQFIVSKKDHWYPTPQVALRDVDDTNRLTISIWMQHRMNFQEMGVRFERRELVLQEMIRILRELEIEYRLHPLDVNLRNLPGESSRLPSTWLSVS